MRILKRHTSAVLATAVLYVATSVAHADTLTLNPVASWSFSGPFGLAFDGANLQVSQNSGLITELNPTTGLPTGKTTPNPAGWSALAWTGTQLAGASGHTVYKFDKYTAGNQSTVTLAGSGGYSLIDGLDIGNGGQIFWSPDVSPLFQYDSAGNLIAGNIPVPPGAGFSGIQFINDSVLGPILVVVNDAYSPRKLTVAHLDGTLIAEAQFANARYEDLAFDGHYLYAADYYGNKIDKYGLNVGGVVVGGSVPDTGATLPLLGGAIGLVLSLVRRSSGKR